MIHVKTKFISFQKPRIKLALLTHSFTIANNIVPQVNSIKMRDLTFQSRHSWLPYIKDTKAKCIRALNILKILSHPTHGCQRKILLLLYTSLIRSILDYGSPIYGLASTSHLKLLYPIQNSALRIASKAFRTSPTASLCAETGILPLHCRRTITNFHS